MSMLDDLLARLSERNVSDMEIDKIVENANKVAAEMGDSAVVQEALTKVLNAANDKKGNKDLESAPQEVGSDFSGYNTRLAILASIDNIKTGAEMTDAVNDYIRRVEANPENANHTKLYGLSNKMCDMTRNGIDVLDAANALCHYLDSCAEPESTVSACAEKVLSMYKARSKYEMKPKDAVSMLRNVDKLTYMTDGNHCTNLASVAYDHLQDKKVAETYLNLIGKHAKNQDYVLDNGNIIRCCGKIVLHQPEIAMQCMDVAARVVDKLPPFEHNYRGNKETMKVAKSLYRNVASDDRIIEAVRAQARCKGKMLEDKMATKDIMEGKRVVLSPDKPARLVEDKVVTKFDGRDGR